MLDIHRDFPGTQIRERNGQNYILGCINDIDIAIYKHVKISWIIMKNILSNIQNRYLKLEKSG